MLTKERLEEILDDLRSDEEFYATVANELSAHIDALTARAEEAEGAIVEWETAVGLGASMEARAKMSRIAARVKGGGK